MHSAPALTPTALIRPGLAPAERRRPVAGRGPGARTNHPRPAPARPNPPAPAPARPNRAFRAWVHPLGGAAILAVLLWRLGTGPFVAGVRLIDGWAVAAALGLGALTTVCCAWRWHLVAAGLGLRLPLPAAVADCYRSVFLNATLPGGVLGDVHRAVAHGREVGDVGRGIRVVVWERTAGQVVQLALALAVLLALPSPVRPYLPAALAVLAAAGLAVLLLARALPAHRFQRWRRPLRTARADIRAGLLARGTWLRVAVASAVAVSGHLAMFLIAARTAGADAPLARLAPLTLLALLAMGLPANVGGFGPREGVAAWAFGAAGLTAAQGVATAVVYGALVLVSSLPGAAVLVGRRISVPAPVSAKGAVVG